MRDDTDRYQHAGIVVLGVNGANAASHERFAQHHRLNIPLLVDKGLRVAKRYGAVTSIGPFRFVKRTVVGINRQGTIVFYQRGIPGTAEILAAFTP